MGRFNKVIYKPITEHKLTKTGMALDIILPEENRTAFLIRTFT